MPYHFIPNTNHDLVVIEAAPVLELDDTEVLQFAEYPIIGWKIEEHPDEVDIPMPIAVGWDEPFKLHGDEWGILDKRQGVVFNDHGQWRCPVGAWKDGRGQEFAERQAAKED